MTLTNAKGNQIQCLLEQTPYLFLHDHSGKDGLKKIAKYNHIKSNEAKQYQTWTNWFQQGQSDGSMIHGDPDEHRNFLFGSLFYLHHWYAITDNESYAHIQPFIEKMIDRMYSTQFQRLK